MNRDTQGQTDGDTDAAKRELANTGTSDSISHLESGTAATEGDEGNDTKGSGAGSNAETSRVRSTDGGTPGFITGVGATGNTSGGSGSDGHTPAGTLENIAGDITGGDTDVGTPGVPDIGSAGSSTAGTTG